MQDMKWCKYPSQPGYCKESSSHCPQPQTNHALVWNATQVSKFCTTNWNNFWADNSCFFKTTHSALAYHCWNQLQHAAEKYQNLSFVQIPTPLKIRNDGVLLDCSRQQVYWDWWHTESETCSDDGRQTLRDSSHSQSYSNLKVVDSSLHPWSTVNRVVKVSDVDGPYQDTDNCDDL